jgi:hypothetical protein
MRRKPVKDFDGCAGVVCPKRGDRHPKNLKKGRIYKEKSFFDENFS